MVRNSPLSLFPIIHIHRWKLLLGPTEPSAAMKDQIDNDLPRAKTIVDVFSDFMRYLFDSTKALFISSDQNGRHRWNSVSRNIELVLTHPNGWGGPQQQQLRTAAVRANIVPDTPEGYARVHFVTEGEASFNFCAAHTPAGANLKVIFVIIACTSLPDVSIARGQGADCRRRGRNDRHKFLCGI